MKLKTTQHLPFLSEIAIGEPIPVNKLAFFQARLRNRLFDLVLKRFLEQQNSGLTKAELARRIGKSPEQITRLLGAPGNWTLDTASDLLIGIAGEELKMGTESVLGRVARNYQGQDWHTRVVSNGHLYRDKVPSPETDEPARLNFRPKTLPEGSKLVAA